MSSSNTTTWRRTIWRVAGWGLAAAALLLACLVWSARGVAAELSEQSLQLGRSLGEWQRFAGNETAVLWNGQELSFHAQTVNEPVSQVVQNFARACGAERNRTAAELTSTLQDLGAEPPRDVSRALILRELRGEAEGTGLCFAGLAEAGISEAVERFRRFTVDMDLTEIGPVRYLYARKLPAGTQLFLITAEGPLSLKRVWSTDGKDVEGTEPIAGARPKSSVRFMSLRTLSSPFALNAYESTQRATQLLSDYAAQAQTLGYEALDLEQLSQGIVPTPQTAREVRVLRNGDALLIATALDRASGSVMSVVQMPRAVADPGPEAWAENL